MDYTIFAMGPNGEEIYSDSSGKCFFKNKRGKYESLQYEKLSGSGNSYYYADVTTKNFSQAGSFYINGQAVSPKQCTFLDSVSHLASTGAEHGGGGSRRPSTITDDVGGYTTDNYKSAIPSSFIGNNGGVGKNISNRILKSIQSNVSFSSFNDFDFTIDSEMQDELSSDLTTAADAFDQKVTHMYREIGNMANYWVGEDYDAYCHATDGYKIALGDLSDSIRMYGKHFEKMSKSTEELTSQLIEIVETCTSRHVK